MTTKRHIIFSQADCEVVPCEATVYAQIVESDLADRLNRLHPIQLTPGGVAIDPPNASPASSTSLSLHDIQMSQMKPEWFKALSDPIPVFK